MQKKKINQLGGWTAIGVGLGAALSVGMHNPAGWAMGIALGLAFGLIKSRQATE